MTRKRLDRFALPLLVWAESKQFLCRGITEDHMAREINNENAFGHALPHGFELLALGDQRAQPVMLPNHDML